MKIYLKIAQLTDITIYFVLGLLVWQELLSVTYYQFITTYYQITDEQLIWVADEVRSAWRLFARWN